MPNNVVDVWKTGDHKSPLLTSNAASASVTFTGVSELVPSTVVYNIPTASAVQPAAFAINEWKSVPQDILLTNQSVKWWKTQGASSEDEYVRQGTLYLKAANAATSFAKSVIIEIEYEIEFTGVQAQQFGP